MIQIRKIREYLPKGQSKSKKYDSKFDPDIYAETLHELLSDPSKFVSQIPENERFNVFFTVGHMPPENDGKSRKWSYQDVIPFDIDNIEYIDDKPNPKYLDALAKALDVDLTKCVVVATGNGLQALIKPREIIKDAKWFDQNKKYYKAVSQKIADSLKEHGLKGELDVSAFEPNRLFRLPLTSNVKPDKPKRVANLIYSKLETLDWDLKTVSGLPDVSDEEALPVKAFARLRLDQDAIESGCEFLKWAKQEPGNVSEPLWYAMLSIIGRLPGGDRLAHEYSKGHGDYSSHTVDRKLTQALDASGPRTCDSINKYWGRCKECPNFGKVNSPISLKGENFIATLDSFFHQMGKKGGMTPIYADLAKYYELKSSFINVNKSHYVWNGSHWKNKEDEFIRSFAQKHFTEHLIDNRKASEFHGIISRANLRETDFFNNTIDRHLNLENGCLNIDTMKLEPHSQDRGFQWTLPFKYDAIAECPMFDKFIKDVTCGDETLENVLLEFMGYCLSNDEPFAQKFAVLTGFGSNGKSTLVEVLKALGAGGFTSLSGAQLVNTFDTTALQWSMFNVTNEMPKYADAKFWEQFKNLTGGTDITASKKNKDAFQFKVKTKFLLLVNSMPTGGEPNDGLFRRFLIIPFDAKFSKESGNLVKNIGQTIIKNELPGVLNKVLFAYHRLVANDYEFTPSEKTAVALEEYKADADTVTRWANEHVVQVNPRAKENVESEWFKRGDGDEFVAVIPEMRSAYAKWCEDSGENAVGELVFTKRVRRYLADKKFPNDKSVAKIGGKPRNVFRGIGFATTEEF